jgi:hypothetical protein
MSQPAGTHRRQPRVSPFVIWRWGFSVLLIGVGIWLVVARPTIAGVQGRTLGWVVIGYALLRLILGHLSDPQRRALPSRRQAGNGEST